MQRMDILLYPLSFLFPPLATIYLPTYQIWLDPNPANAPCLCPTPHSQPRIKVLLIFQQSQFLESPCPIQPDSSPVPSRIHPRRQRTFPNPSGWLRARPRPQVRIQFSCGCQAPGWSTQDSPCFPDPHKAPGPLPHQHHPCLFQQLLLSRAQGHFFPVRQGAKRNSSAPSPASELPPRGGPWGAGLGSQVP